MSSKIIHNLPSTCSHAQVKLSADCSTKQNAPVSVAFMTYSAVLSARKLPSTTLGRSGLPKRFSSVLPEVCRLHQPFQEKYMNARLKRPAHRAMQKTSASKRLKFGRLTKDPHSGAAQNKPLGSRSSRFRNANSWPSSVVTSSAGPPNTCMRI